MLAAQAHKKVMQELQKDRPNCIEELIKYLAFEQEYQRGCSVEQVRMPMASDRMRCNRMTGGGACESRRHVHAAAS